MTTLASLSLLAPTQCPVRMVNAAAKDNGTMKKSPEILREIECAATTVAPKGLKIMAPQEKQETSSARLRHMGTATFR